MPTTICTIAGETFRLDYSKSSTKDGIEYRGTLYTNPALVYSYRLFENIEIAFNPFKTPKYWQKEIVKGIKRHIVENSKLHFSHSFEIVF
jgi:hypothetical protein